MDIALLILIGLVALTAIGAFWKGRWQLVVSGLKQGGQTLKMMWFRLLLGMLFGGLIQVLIPSELIAEWLGPASGWKGIIIASYAGVIISGGPFVTMPILASIYAAGAGVGPVIAFLVSMNMVGVRILIAWQIPFLGAKLALVRYLVCFFVPPLVGIVGGALYQLLGIA